MTDNVIKLPGSDPTSTMLGPDLMGQSVILDGRLIPNLHAHDRGKTIEFVLDGRMAYEFPREWAWLAGLFAANAMAIGAGFPSINGKRCEHFGPQVSQIVLGDPA
jgi:hypothetical protein